MGIEPEGVESLMLNRGLIATGGEEFGKIGLEDSGQDMRDVEFEGWEEGNLAGQPGWVHGIGRGWDG